MHHAKVLIVEIARGPGGRANQQATFKGAIQLCMQMLTQAQASDPKAVYLAARGWALYMEPARKAEAPRAQQLMVDALTGARSGPDPRRRPGPPPYAGRSAPAAEFPSHACRPSAIPARV